MKIIDTLVPDHRDNKRDYTVGQAIAFARELQEADGVVPNADESNYKVILGIYDYEVVE